MGNGSKEPLHFTRDDAERLKAIEVLQTSIEKKLTALCDNFSSFVIIHNTLHTKINEQIIVNTNFRKMTKKILIWFFTSSIFLGALVSIAGTIGWTL